MQKTALLVIQNTMFDKSNPIYEGEHFLEIFRT
ncbi:hypothetical protein J2S10_004540 [Neobacillus ginsengisoli]|uniref:Uncharacterized protein n=1 Tax=Neobacillus ginsengisoli TaxID=904295 RepID=A0ABT9Y0I0_9BACI|nr:hypothetical protein [Neobacillus ginsengisoli]